RFAPRARWAALLPILLILVVLPTNVYLVGWRINDMLRHNPPYFLPRAQVAAIDWLRENTPPEAVVLSSLELGQFIPGLAGNRAFLAHWSGTLDYYDKQHIVSQFFDVATSDEQRRVIIARYNIEYIVSSDS